MIDKYKISFITQKMQVQFPTGECKMARGRTQPRRVQKTNIRGSPENTPQNSKLWPVNSFPFSRNDFLPQ